MHGIVLDDAGSREVVAGLSLLERMVLMLHAAGVGAVTVVGGSPLPRWRRCDDLGIRVEHARRPPEVAPAAVASGALFVLPADVGRVVEAQGRLVGSDGRALPLRVERGTSGPECARVSAAGPAFLVDGEAARDRAEALLWASLATSADGVVDTWLNRPLGRPLAKLLARTSVSPNQVTVAGTLVGIAGAAAIASGEYAASVVGALVFQLSAVFDCVDGELARVMHKQSRAGKWLDLGLDQVAHGALFAGITFHCLRTAPGTPALALGISAICGALVSFAVVVRGMRLAQRRANPRLSATIDRMTNRDFTLVVLACAVAGRLEVFLWLVGTLTHGFWMLALAAQLRQPVAATEAGR